MKQFLLFCTCFISITANAQSWAPSGATWYYNVNNGPVVGYVKIAYEGDILIGSDTWKRLERYGIGYNYISVSYFNDHHGTWYTREVDSVVYIYNTFTAVADTLYNFKAHTGDGWQLTPHFTGLCTTGYVTVLNTGTSTINGQNLKWLYLEIDFTDDTFPAYTDTLYQKIGPRGFFKLNNLCANAPDASEGGGLRCYSDDIFGTYHVSSDPCDFILSAPDMEENLSHLVIFPNPATGNYITVSNVVQPTGFVLTDLKGQTIKTGTLQPGNNTIETRSLEAGMYLLFAGPVPYRIVIGG